MPTPGKNETHDDFIARCIPIVIHDGTAQDGKQGYAVCESLWSKRAMNKPMEKIRAYSILSVKRVSDELRKIEGMATTPTTDRMGDIVEPLGITYKNPLPLLWQHNHDQPVAHVKFAKPTEKGIAFEAHIADPDKATSQALKDRLLEAWDSVKMGLVKGVSIGFVPTEY